MPSRATPALQRALEFLESLRAAGPEPGERLPTLQVLAHKADVSLRTMQKATRLLAQRGILSVRPRAGIRWADSSTAVSSPRSSQTLSVRGSRAERLVDEIEKAILIGDLPDPLPSVKSLRARYRAGHLAVRKALAVLAEQGAIVRRGREWTVARAESRGGQSGIMFVAPSDDLARYAIYGPKAEAFCTAFERECSNRKTRLHFKSGFRPVSPDPSLLGYVIVATHHRENATDIARGLQGAGRPIVVVDVIGDCPVPSFPHPRQASFVGIQGARSAGRQVALALREIGHKRVAYISAYKPGVMKWVGDRLEGIRDVYGTDVVALTAPDLEDIAGSRVRVETEVVPGLVEDLHKLNARINSHVELDSPDWVREQIVPRLAAHYAQTRLHSLLQQALADPTITALVGANDDVAVSVLRYLSQKRVAVPSRVSVVGFDGSRDGVLAGLASFDYNTPAFVKTALDLVLRPQPTRDAAGPLVVEIPGVLVGRATLGPPRR